jgi:hypothetical protein
MHGVYLTTPSLYWDHAFVAICVAYVHSGLSFWSVLYRLEVSLKQILQQHKINYRLVGACSLHRCAATKIIHNIKLICRFSLFLQEPVFQVLLLFFSEAGCTQVARDTAISVDKKKRRLGR